ncbi:hypothetical protein LOK74_02440 [Brevibacillus humidisoli]|uniref:hypothetical protein n=1 Tax=Brevibacillus humidisoli TaxID=2895522 RepID=UPI001E393E4D|nr:hypothetical protein [Brevibacillus humidisoli]UFJ41416.1 hypothetical protein LOK74_02440 [Brevibacillus humidisoli]
MQETANRQMSEAESLAWEGCHAWSSLYGMLVQRMRIPIEQRERVVQLPIDQADYLLRHGNRLVRSTLVEKWEEIWSREAECFACILNQLSGLRLAVYQQRGWDFVLKEPLQRNRLSILTLQAMWEAIDLGKERLIPFLQRKAKLLGKEKLGWHEVRWPIGRIFRLVDPMEAFLRLADWAEANCPMLSRFARSLAAQTQPAASRSGTLAEVAGMMGQAFIQGLVRAAPSPERKQGIPPLYSGDLAAAFLEQWLADYAIAAASSVEEKLAIIEEKLQRAVYYLMQMHARFLFELRFYERRKRGPVAVNTLNQLMLDAQSFAYGEALETYHPYDWASDEQFYRVAEPFCHFQQTFAYLLGSWIYRLTWIEGAFIEQSYIRFLQAGGRGSTEEQAARCFSVDLQSSDFWWQAMQSVLIEVDLFLRYTESSSH